MDDLRLYFSVNYLIINFIQLTSWKMYLYSKKNGGGTLKRQYFKCLFLTVCTVVLQ